MNKKCFLLPPNKPLLPRREHYRYVNSEKKELIYRDVSVLGDDTDVDLELYFSYQEEGLPPPPEIRWWHNLSLQDVVDLAPPNTKLSDIILSIDTPSDLAYIDVTFSKYERDLDFEEGQYKKALKQYEEDLIKYEERLKEYEEKRESFDKEQKKQEIKNLEQHIRNLKREIK